jgi:flagellar L-ring protein precursor FlgH
MRTLITLALSGALAACSVLPPQPMSHSPGFEPVYPNVTHLTDAPATGGIYVSQQSDSWFGRGRKFKVGDVITVVLNESTQAARTTNSNLSRESSNDALPGLQTFANGLGGVMQGANMAGGKITNKGVGAADQQASLNGQVAVSVVDILPNGNLVLRGEKQLALSEGTEVIQVAGIIRPDDIAPNNTVQSRRLANAQIAYRGTGDLAAATRPGWGTNALMKLWPF